MHMKVFAGRGNPALAHKICEYLEMPVGKISVGDFPDGETFVKVEEDVRGRDVFIIQPTCPPVNDNLMELLIMIDSFKRASAARITAVMPYYGYARQDRKDEGRTPITAKLAANLITRAGADRVLAVDLHAAQLQGFFDIPVDHLFGAPVLDQYFKAMAIADEELAVVSPDEGSIKRALRHASTLGGCVAIVDKRRASADCTQQANLIGGPVEGKIALLFDDMISTAGSICGAAEMVKRAGAREIYLSATHGIFCGNAIDRLHEAPIEGVVVTDTIPLDEGKLTDRIHILTIAPLIGEAVKRIHCNESVSHLFVNGV